MSEFPEWLEREKGIFWDPSHEEAQEIHRQLRTGELKPQGISREAIQGWWHHLRGRLKDHGEQ